MFCVILRINYFSEQQKLIGPSNGDAVCLLWGRNWTFKYYFDELQASKSKQQERALTTVRATEIQKLEIPLRRLRRTTVSCLSKLWSGATRTSEFVRLFSGHKRSHNTKNGLHTCLPVWQPHVIRLQLEKEQQQQGKMQIACSKDFSMHVLKVSRKTRGDSGLLRLRACITYRPVGFFSTEYFRQVVSNPST